MKIYNSLTRQVEEFVPIYKEQSPTSHSTTKGAVGMYTCGPTIYDRKQIGNFRTYTLSDLVYRLLKYNGFEVSYIMNFTDVGHLTGDNAGDADAGEDRLVKAAKRERKSAWDVAKMYEEMFIEDFDKLNLTRPDKFVKATDHIAEQIEMVKQLEDKGMAYKVTDGMYFDTVAYERLTGFVYGELSDLDQRREGARVEPNPEKRNPRDFALWKFSPLLEQRDMEWASPWGKGFPGWHIECSAMATKYLGEQFDVHVGGLDIKSTHHPNEIAQAQAVSGKQFVKYWIHGGLLMVDGERMATSLNNNFKIPDIIERGFTPLALRYLYLTAHYRGPLNFTWSSMAGAQNALDKLRQFVEQSTRLRQGFGGQGRVNLSKEKLKKLDGYGRAFNEAINNDLGFPQAIAVMWEMLKSNLSDVDKLDLLLEWDQVLGLKLGEGQVQVEVTEDARELLKLREELRNEGKFVQADQIRVKLEKLGWIVEDVAGGSRLKKSRMIS